MGMGAFKAFDGGLGVAEGELATAGSDGALGIPALGWNALYTGIALEGAHEFGQGFHGVFGSDDSASSPPAGMVANSDRRADSGSGNPGAAAGRPNDAEADLDPTRREALHQAKRDAKVPVSEQPEKTDRVPLRDKNGKKIIGSDGLPRQTFEYTYKTTDGGKITIQDHGDGHYFGEGGIGDQGPHFNVRPGNDPGGKVDGTEEHYPFRK
jgi:hypothetical protein